jgi:hypothetical protein
MSSRFLADAAFANTIEPRQEASKYGRVTCDDGTVIVGTPVTGGGLVFDGLCPSCWRMPLPPGGEQCLRCDALDTADAEEARRYVAGKRRREACGGAR